MSKVHKNAAEQTYDITFTTGDDPKERLFSGWKARNSVDATESFERAKPGTKVVKIERQVVSHLV